MKRRLFLVIPMPETVQRYVEALKTEFPNQEFRWLSGQDLHVTVVPPWYTDDEHVGEISKALRGSIAGVQGFDAACTVVRFGPSGQVPRLLWAVGPMPSGLRLLKSTAERALMSDYRIGFEKKDTKPIRLHVTLARFRSGLIKKNDSPKMTIDWRFPVTEVVLMESVLNSKGAEYGVVETFELGSS